jgi:hypothetical protein
MVHFGPEVWSRISTKSARLEFAAGWLAEEFAHWPGRIVGKTEQIALRVGGAEMRRQNRFAFTISGKSLPFHNVFANFSDMPAIPGVNGAPGILNLNNGQFAMSTVTYPADTWSDISGASKGSVDVISSVGVINDVRMLLTRQ